MQQAARAQQETVFEQAARIFGGATDAETGLRVLRLRHDPPQHDRVALKPFHMPWVLPDGSGVIFAASWYLV